MASGKIDKEGKRGSFQQLSAGYQKKECCYDKIEITRQILLFGKHFSEVANSQVNRIF